MASTIPSAQDLTSILNQVKGLEEEKAKLIQLLEDERRKATEASAKAEQLSQAKRAEMMQLIDTVIAKWLQDSVADEKVREQFKTGMTRLADKVDEQSGVWQVVCNASELHAKHLHTIEQMRLENEELKGKVNGEFKEDSSRKRGREPDEKEQGDIWYAFKK